MVMLGDGRRIGVQAPEMIPVQSHDGMFWGIYYLQAGNGMKFNNEKELEYR